jgi:deferrochelatase/peroxidase EfeB
MPASEPGEAQQGLSRRGFIGIAAGAAGGAAVTFGAVKAVNAEDSVEQAGTASTSTTTRSRQFEGTSQGGITERPPAIVLAASLNSVAADRAGLAETFRTLTGAARKVVDEPTAQGADHIAPLPDTGVLGPNARTGLHVTVSVGASLFDDRYGLAGQKPRHLTTMPFLANDRLDPHRSHGDVLLVIQGDYSDNVQHGLRQLLRATRAGLVLHWLLSGWTRPDPAPQPGRTDNRNLMGFKDGTANPDGADGALMNDLVWVADGDGEPAWATGGSYQVVRTIRMFVEQWDRTPLFEQEAIIGRRKESGAPIGMRRESDVPVFSGDPQGKITPLDAHIRLANPRSPEAMRARILRRGFSYARGYDGAGQLDQGLAFVSYQRRLQQFLDIQARLAGEPLEEYTQVDGGGFYFALPGVQGRDDWLGRSLITEV